MDSQQQFCLKWNSFGSNLATTFGNLFKSESLTDVTLFCQGVTFKAHRLILAACSKHFQDLFETAPLSPSVLVILDGTSSSNMSALLEFMYKGEVHVSQECLSSFLKAAECLQVDPLSYHLKKVLCMQASSSASERNCSSVGFILNARRSLLHPDNVDALLFIHSNSIPPPLSMTNKLRTLSNCCIQVKGLSIEHEKLAVVHGKHVSPESHESQLDSPTGRKLTKLNSSGNSGGNGGTKEMLDGNPAADQLHPQHHASTSASASYSPVMSPYMHPPHYRPAYEQRVPASAPASSHYDASPRKRHHRSSSEAMQDAAAVRASVLRDGSKARPTEAEKLSPMSLAYRPSLSQPQPQVESESKSDDKVYQSGSSQLHMRYEGGPDARDSAASNAAASATAAVTFDRTAAVDIENNIKIKSESRRQSLDPGNSCPEDLRIKMELCGHGEEQQHGNTAPYAETSADQAPEMITANVWNSGSNTKLISIKGSASTTSDSKKLKCPFCERLYGYETNLRAHIRQRHQGIRVPCPFCSRTFTRNNTVRRHIAREHKSEYTMKAFPHTQPHEVHNHNNQ